jgi:hypothetical protein
MISRLLLVTFTGLIATSIAAAENSDLSTDHGTRPISADEDVAARSKDWESLSDAFATVALLDDSTGGPLATNDDRAQETESDSRQRPFHPVCDCGGGLPCLDHWCVCDVAYCNGPICDHHPCECSYGVTRMTENGEWVSNDARCDVWGPPVYASNAAARFGWWAVGSDGSQQKTGEFQDLSSSPFWDVDAIYSDGVRTWDIVLSGLDQEANDAHVQYYNRHFKATFDFQRYLRRLDHDPVVGLDLAPGQAPPPTPEGNVIVDDLNIGEDYAIRIEELEAQAKGKLMDHVTWRMNVWGLRKFGERQSTSTSHCFNVLAPAPPGATGNVCHVLSERQTIDWTTVEFKPTLEAKFENVTVAYERTMRSFGQDDQVIDRQHTRFGFSPASGVLGPDFAYALVPENMTQIDRIKVSAKLTDTNQLYANIFHGDTKNEFRDMHRESSGYDLRLTNTSFDDMTVTGYTSRYDEETDFPPFALESPPFAPAPVPPNPSYDAASLRHPVDYNRLKAGIKSSWQPFGDRGPRRSNYGLFDGTSLASGYEYYLLERTFATYDTALGPFTQPNTKSHQIEFGPSTRWSRVLQTYTRYKVKFIDDPLIGVREHNGLFNTNQPEQLHITELGTTWTPYSNFMTTAQVSSINSWNDSEFANFVEDDYPIMLSAWYAPTHRLSFTGGYAYFSNFIDQDITLGFTVPNVPVPPVVTETTRWDYWGENHLFSFNANYALTKNVQLIGGYEFNRGSNTFMVPPSPAGANWSALPSIADVIVETQRLTTGLDWQPYCDMNIYVRYIFFDYDDISSDLTSGTAHMGLAGVTRTW